MQASRLSTGSKRSGSPRAVLGEHQSLSVSSALSIISPVKKSGSNSPALSFSLQSQDSVIAEISQFPDLTQSPGQFSCSESAIEEKENVEKTTSGHHRQPSVIIKANVEQSYTHILSVLRTTAHPRSNNRDHSVSFLTDSQLNPYSKSHSPAVPIIEVDLDPGEKPYRTPIANSQKNGSYTSPYGGTTNHTESNHFEIDLFESGQSGTHSGGSLGAMPAKTYCPRCLVDVSTSVSMQLPRLPFWKTLCLLGDFGQCCLEEDPLLQYQEILHHCRRCKRLLARVTPA